MIIDGSIRKLYLGKNILWEKQVINELQTSVVNVNIVFCGYLFDTSEFES